MAVFNKTIIPLALVGYEMIIANLALRASLGIYHLISNACSWNNSLRADVSYFFCFTREAKEIGDVCTQANGIIVLKLLYLVISLFQLILIENEANRAI